jgi:hypothetical protein
MAAKMAMTLEQTRQAIIDRMQAFTGIHKPSFGTLKPGKFGYWILSCVIPVKACIRSIIACLKLLPVLRKTESSIQIYQALRFQRKVCGAA